MGVIENDTFCCTIKVTHHLVAVASEQRKDTQSINKIKSAIDHPVAFMQVVCRDGPSVLQKREYSEIKCNNKFIEKYVLITVYFVDMIILLLINFQYTVYMILHAAATCFGSKSYEAKIRLFLLAWQASIPSICI
jgi:hypothetical protein